MGTLNKYLQPVGSPIDNTTEQQAVVPWQWGVTQSISTRKIKASNLYIQKKLGGGTVQGLKVEYGSPTIFNQSGNPSHDYLGAASMYNFGYNFGTSAIGLNQSIGTAGAIITGGTLTDIISRTTLVLILVSVGWYNVGNGTDGNGIIRLYGNGTELYRMVLAGTYRSLIYTEMHYLGTFGAGTQTFTIGGTQDGSGTNTITIYHDRFSYVNLGV